MKTDTDQLTELATQVGDLMARLDALDSQSAAQTAAVDAAALALKAAVDGLSALHGAPLSRAIENLVARVEALEAKSK